MSGADAGVAVRWPPLARRAVLLGLGPAQVASFAGGLAAAVVALRALPGGAGLLVGILCALGGAAAGCWPVAGDPPVRWLPVLGGWLVRRRRHLDPQPLAGAPEPATAAVPVGASGGRAGRPSPTAPSALALRHSAGGPGEAPLGVVEDRRAGRWAAVVPVSGPALDLLGPSARADVAGRWSAVLAGVGHPGSAVRRLQWVASRRPADPAALLAAAAAARGPAAAADAYRRLVSAEAPAALDTGCLLVVAVGAGRSGGLQRDLGRTLDTLLRRELRLLTASLRAAGLAPAAPLDPEGLSAALAAAADPACHRALPGGPWPLAVDEAWSHVRTDGCWHATWWVAAWPQVPVGPDLLSPLLSGPPGLTVSLTMAPVPAERAVREARAARTAALADDALRSRAGFVGTAHAARRAEAASRREEELADGHAEHRCTAYVTASAASEEELAARCAEVEAAAGRAGLVLRRLHGRQAEARTWTLPIGRGLR